MATYNGKSYSDTRNLNLRGGARGTGLLRWTPPQSGVPALWSSNPFSTDDYGLYLNASGQLVFSSTGTTTILGAAGAGGVPSWEQIYTNDKTLTVDSTTFTIDGTHATNNNLSLTMSGAGSGHVLDIDNAGTGYDINGTDAWFVTKTGAATFLDVDTATLTNTTGNIILKASGAGTVTIGANTNTVTIAKAATFSSTITVTDGLTDLISTSNTASGLRVTNNTVTTYGAAAASAGVVVFRSTSLTTGDLLRLQLTEANLTTGNYLNCYDATGTESVFEIGENGVTTILGAAAANALVVTNGDVSFADASLTIVDADNAATLSITNDTATSASVFVFAGSGVFTGTTTTSFMTITPSGLTTGTALYLAAAGATTSVGVVDIIGAALVSGSLVRLTTNTASFTTGGKALEITLVAATAGNGITVTTTGAYTGTGLAILTAGAMTSGIGLSVVSTTGLTSGSLIRATSSTAGAIATNGAISFAATGDFTSTSNQGYVGILANTTTAGTIMSISGTSATTGVGLYLTNGTSGMTTGSLIRVAASGTGTVATNGIVSIRHAGIFVSTSYIGVLDVQADAMVGTASNATLVNFKTTAAAQVDTTVLNVENSGFTTGYTGSMLRIKSPTTTGACKLIDVIADGITSGGTVMNISVAALTTGDALVISNGTSAITTGSLIKVSASGTGAISSDGIVSFQHAGIFTGTTVGFLNVLASATTAGTLATFTSSAMTTGTNLQISSAAITSGKHFNVLGAAGSSHFSIGVNGLTTIAGSAQGTDALVITAGDILLTSGHIDMTSGNLTLASGNLSVTGTLTATGATSVGTLLYKDLTEVVTGTNIITAAESGSVFFLDSATEFVSTLPAVAAGLHFTFIVKTAPSGASYTIVTDSSANIIKGQAVNAAGAAGDTGTSDDTINFIDGQAVAGDRVDVWCDGTNWFAYGTCAVAAGITFTTAS